MSSKRKREAKTTELRVSAVHAEPEVVVGLFFNGVQIPEDTKFEFYRNKKTGEHLLHGENDTLDYNGGDADSHHDYLVALYDPVHKSVDLYKAPVIDGKITSRSKRVHRGPRVKQAGIRYADQRKALGESFGTKKAKSALTNLERNKIDADKLQDLELDIIDNVKEHTVALPTNEEISQAVQDDRPVPPCNEAATAVEDIYSLHSIIPKREWSSIRVQPLMDAEEAERLDMLPYSKSNYVNKRLAIYVAQGNVHKVTQLYYASFLLGVYVNRRVRDKNTLMEKLGNKPAEVLVDGVLERFAIAKASQFGRSKSRSFVIDPHHEDKLLCYLIALFLHIDSFLVELPPLANELNMKPTRLVGLCRALGAAIKVATQAQAEAFGVPKNAAATYKVASLKVPFKLPQMTRMGRR